MCVNVFVEVNFWLPVLNKNKIDVHWLLAHFRKGGQAVLIRGRSMISQALRAGVISSAPPRHCTNPLPVKHLITIKDAGIKSLIYLAFRSKITPALQATSSSASWTVRLVACCHSHPANSRLVSGRHCVTKRSRVRR